MKDRPFKLLTSIIAVSLAAKTLPAHANKAEIDSAEAKVKVSEKRLQTKSRSYTDQLMSLARVYLNNNKENDAKLVFKKAISNLKSQPQRKAEIPALMSAWAMTLVNHNANLREDAEKVMLEGLQLANELPPASKQRIQYLLEIIDFYKAIGKRSEMLARIKAADQHLASLEKNQKLTNDEIIQVALSLVTLAEYRTFPMPQMRFKQPTVRIVPDNSPDLPNTVKESEFKDAETFRLRALTQFDRLPETMGYRVEAHRALIYWYRRLGKTKEEDFQTKRLSELLQTSDRRKLFPESDGCPACGMG